MINENVQAQVRVRASNTVDHTMRVLAAVIWNIHLKRVLRCSPGSLRLVCRTIIRWT